MTACQSVMVTALGIVHVQQLPPLTEMQREVLVRGFERRYGMEYGELAAQLGWDSPRLASVLSRVVKYGMLRRDWSREDWVSMTQFGRLVRAELVTGTP